jgi:hypothetical protein
MKTSHLLSALLMGAALVAGPAMAQMATSPSNTPNDGTAVPPRTSVPAGQKTPAPEKGSTQNHPAGKSATHKSSTSKMGSGSAMKHKDAMGTAPSTNKANMSAPSDSQPYPNTGAK